MGLGITDEANGNSVAIGDDRRLRTSAVTENEIAYISREEESTFVIYAKRDFAAAATNESIFCMKYTGSKRLKVHSITFSSNSPDAKVEVYYDPTYTSGGATLSIDSGISNENRQSSKPLEVVAYHGATTLVMTVDSNLEVLDVRLNRSTFEKKFEGLILGKNDSIGIIGSVQTIAEKIRCMVECYEVEIRG